jgi:hypothetical protein
MRTAFLLFCLLSPALVAREVHAQTAPVRKTLPPTPVTKSAVPQATVPQPAAAQSANPWKAVLRVVPNPLPAGRCATAAVEIQDPDGYRATTLSNGSVIDFHQFVYKSSDMTAFNWQDGNPIFGVICAPATATAAHTTISVTLPDGLAASVDLTTVAPGASVAAVVYPPQGQLRPAGLASAQLQTIPPVAALPPTAPSPTGAGANPPIGVAEPASSGSTPWLGTLTLGGSTIPAQLISGGSATADVITSQLATSSIVAKHVANLSFVPMVLSVQPSSTLATWINSAWSGSPTSMDGAVNAQPGAMTSIAGHLAFTSGHISSTRIPELPATSRSGALTIGISPELVKAATSGPTAASIKAEPITGFRFSVSGMTTGTVTRIASFEVATTLPSDAVGETRDYQRVRFRPVFPEIYISIEERTAQDWIAWYNALINGQVSAADQKTFTLELIAANTATPVATIKGYGVGIVSLRANPIVNGKQTLEAELYVTRMEFLAPGSK